MTSATVFTRIYLASQSPRRRDLLKQVGIPHDLLLLRNRTGRVVDVDEALHAKESPNDYVQRLCLEKAGVASRVAALRGLPLQPLLAADTTVCVSGDILGKPQDATEAAAMLQRLSARSHEVFTAVALQLGERVESRVSRSVVTVRALSAEDIQRYVVSGESLDKAGAYAIQGRAAAFVARIDGSYSGVMGLPLFETAELLALFGYII
jgi:septum formation protein